LDFIFQNSEYEVHQVDSGSQNFSFLAFKGEAWHKFSLIPARDRRKEQGSKHSKKVQVEATPKKNSSAIFSKSKPNT
jgi:hypothetical protein